MTELEPRRRTLASEWIIAVLLLGNIFWTTLCLGGYRAETMVWTCTLTAVTLVVHLASAAFSGERTHRASWVLLPFVIYAAYNAKFISPAPWLGWRDWLGWTNAVAVFWLVVNGVRSESPRRILLSGVLVLGAIAVVLACYQHFLWPDWLMLGRKQAAQYLERSSGPFGVPNTLGAFLLLLIVPMIALTIQSGATAVQRILCGYLATVFLLGLGLSISRGAWLALIGVIAVWPLSLKHRSWEWRIGASIAALTLILVVAAATYVSVPQVKDRFDQLATQFGERTRPIMWRAAWKLFESSPVVGTGAGSYDPLFERNRPVGFRDRPEWAHNDYLNTLSDYGALGFVLLFGGIGWIVYQCRSSPRRNSTARWETGAERFFGEALTRGIGLGLLAFAISLFVDFHLKIPGAAMVVALLGAEWVLRTAPAPRANGVGPGPQIARFVAILAVGYGLLAVALPTFRGEAMRADGRGAVDQLAREKNPSLNRQREVLERAATVLIEASVVDPSNGQTWSDRAYVSELWTRVASGRSAELGRQAEEEARNALARSDIFPEFWVRLGVALDLQGKWGEGNRAFGRAIELAPANATYWYYDAYHLSLAAATRPMAAAALRQALELDPTFAPAIALQQSLSFPP